MQGEGPKGYFIKKRIDRPAKIIGLYYNTFFVFIVVAAIIFMAGSKFGAIGWIIGIGIILAIYISLFFVQTKYGPKEIAKWWNEYNNPVHFIEMRKSIKRTLK